MNPLALYLQSHRITEQALAERAGVSRPMLNRIRRGERVPSRHVAQKIEAATGGEVSAVSLLGFPDRSKAAWPRGEGRWAVAIAEDGSAFLSRELVEAFGFEPGDTLIFHPDGDEVRVNSVKRTAAKVQAWFRERVPAGLSVVDEFLAEKRAEAARE